MILDSRILVLARGGVSEVGLADHVVGAGGEDGALTLVALEVDLGEQEVLLQCNQLTIVCRGRVYIL